MRYLFVLTSIVLALTLERADGQIVISDRKPVDPAIAVVEWDAGALKRLQTVPAATASAPRQKQWLMFTSRSCVPCVRSISDFKAWLEASGWIVDESEAAHVRLIYAEDHPELHQQYGIRKWPTFVLLVNGKEVERRSPYPGRQVLAERYNAVASGDDPTEGQGFGAISVGTVPLASEVGAFIDMARPILSDRGRVTITYERDKPEKPITVSNVDLIVPQQTEAVWENTKQGVKVTFTKPISADLHKFAPVSVSVTGFTIERDSITPALRGLPDPRIRLTEK